MKKYLSLTQVLLLFFLQVKLQTGMALNLELTQGTRSAIPIAIQSDSDSSVTSEIAQIIQNDLYHSGEFKLNVQIPDELKANPIHYLKKKGINYYASVSVEENESKLHAKIVLTDPVKSNEKILVKSIDFVKEQLRSAAHHLSDQIYKAITGSEGVFSTRIAYVLKTGTGKNKRYFIEVADFDGHNPQKLIESGEPLMSPVWAPDGSKVAYVSFEKRRAEVYISNIFTGKRELVSGFPGMNQAPSWSPDGKFIALVLSKSGSPRIYLYSLENKSLRAVTKGWAIDTEPTWSRDAKHIFFTSNRGGGPQIYRYDLATHRAKRITFKGKYNATPSITPDGTKLVMLHKHGGMFNVAIQSLKKGAVSLLTHTGLVESPSLSPNGKMVIFSGKQGGKRILSVVSVDGKVKLTLPARQGSVQEPAWSPYLS